MALLNAYVFVGGVIRNSSVDGYWYLFYDVGRVVGLCVDVHWMVVWLSVRTVGTVCEVEGDVQVVNNFHVCLYSYVANVEMVERGALPTRFRLSGIKDS